MRTRNLGILLEQGADFSLIIGISGDCAAIDLTGYSFLGEMKKTTSASDPVVAEFSFEILDQFHNKGQLKWSLSAAIIDEIVLSISNPFQSKRLTTPFVYDIKMKDTLGAVSRIVQGIAYVSPQATEESF